ncbi:MAG: hypothetical protein AUH85_10615 [Chloroflexi bacterium 13_1_40CM_4_68_4]|nr:MAG: hypothetical protein AUH85_10615 [Chloroflexi bacterium 13_1_40CM_4_68_4]
MRFGRIGVAWIAGLVASALPSLLATASGTQAGEAIVDGTSVAVLATLLAVAFRSSRFRPLAGYLAALLAIEVGVIATTVYGRTVWWEDWARNVPTGTRFAAANATKVVPAAALALTLLGSGLHRRDVFLGLGDLRARLRLNARPTVARWWTLAVIALPVSLFPVLNNVVGNRDVSLPFDTALAQAPIIIFGAAANTLLEEFLFRQVLLARLLPVIGADTALAITSIRFGIGHWSGNPAGPMGVLLATGFGLFQGKCMLDCRGSGWPWLVHFANDILIFTLIAMTPTGDWRP